MIIIGAGMTHSLLGGCYEHSESSYGFSSYSFNCKVSGGLFACERYVQMAGMVAPPVANLPVISMTEVGAVEAVESNRCSTRWHSMAISPPVEGSAQGLSSVVMMAAFFPSSSNHKW
jgi:hypothetical protein